MPSSELDCERLRRNSSAALPTSGRRRKSGGLRGNGDDDNDNDNIGAERFNNQVGN